MAHCPHPEPFMSEKSAALVYRRADGLLAAAVGDELLMMSVALGKYFNLNPVGARIWELLETPHTVDGLVEALTAEYEVAPDIARREVDRFLQDLEERKLLSPQ
jgi:hypothetical protein